MAGTEALQVGGLVAATVDLGQDMVDVGARSSAGCLTLDPLALRMSP
jgi:hypothetical protein